MNWYLKVLKQYFDFEGRARRKEFWMFNLFSLIISYGIMALSFATGIDALMYLSYVYSLIVFLPALGVSVRRLHDVGKSGWFIFISLIPIIGTIWLIVLLCTDSVEGSNEYGSNPKNPSDELNDIGVAE